MKDFKKILLDEIQEFRSVGREFINKNISVADFKKASGGMGVYAERGGQKFMIRLRMPSGVTHVSELKLIHEFMTRYGLDKMHLTTRQAIQLHSMDFENVCDLMEECLEYHIYTRGSGGNFPRNVALSPLAGVDINEPFDATPYALAVGNYFLKRIYTYHLPRKLKVSFSSTEKDKAHVTIQDLGFVATSKDGENCFTVYAGGGLGMNPKKAVLIEEYINPKDVLYYVEGMTKFFIDEGDYKNKARARVRYILDRLGEEEFVNKLKQYVEKEKEESNLELVLHPKEITKQGIKIDLEDSRLYSQKQEGLYSVYVHPMGGQLGIKSLEKIIDFIEDIQDVDIRLAMVEGMYIRNLNGNEAKELLELTEDISETTRIGQSVSCIGVPICQMGRCNSQQLLRDIVEKFKNDNYEDNLPRVFISGCPNSCGVHEIGSIGFMGLKIKVDTEFKDAFRLFIDGDVGIGKTKLGIEKADFLPEAIPGFLEDLSGKLKESGKDFNKYIEENSSELEDIIKNYATNILS